MENKNTLLKFQDAQEEIKKPIRSAKWKCFQRKFSSLYKSTKFKISMKHNRLETVSTVLKLLCVYENTNMEPLTE